MDVLILPERGSIMLSKRVNVRRLTTYSVLSMLPAFGAAGTSLAQVALPSFTVSPDIYKVVAENAQ